MKRWVNMVRAYQILIILVLSFPAYPCVWDSDTLADETKNFGNIVEVLSGRFPRNPPLYYEMRLSRVAEELQTKPASLELYDDAGVACDRLNLGNQAIKWMDLKREQLEKTADSATTREHWYRYYANLGTFQAHQWVREGAYTTATALLEKGAENIEQAIKLNADAHFGREQYQLDFMRWLISIDEKDSPRRNDGKLGGVTFLDPLISEENTSDTKHSEELEKASNGLVGLIYLGNAWESVDINYALALIHGKLRNASIRTLAIARVHELLNNDKLPILAPLLTESEISSFYSVRTSIGSPYVDVPVKKLRQNADKWQEHRTAYMMERLKTGHHPDTDPQFWSDYKEIPPVRTFYGRIPGTNISLVVVWEKYWLIIGAATFFISLLLIRDFVVRQRRKKKNGAGDRT